MISGSCQCGALCYELNEAPIDIYVCHCTECRKQSSSAFGISVIVPRDSLRIVAGHAKTWSRVTASGNTLVCSFCDRCGSRISHANPTQETLSIKGGSLSTPVDLGGVVHIWTQSKLPGVMIPPESKCFEQDPF